MCKCDTYSIPNVASSPLLASASCSWLPEVSIPGLCRCFQSVVVVMADRRWMLTDGRVRALWESSADIGELEG